MKDDKNVQWINNNEQRLYNESHNWQITAWQQGDLDCNLGRGEIRAILNGGGKVWQWGCRVFGCWLTAVAAVLVTWYKSWAAWSVRDTAGCCDACEVLCEMGEEGTEWVGDLSECHLLDRASRLPLPTRFSSSSARCSVVSFSSWINLK